MRIAEFSRVGLLVSTAIFAFGLAAGVLVDLYARRVRQMLWRDQSPDKVPPGKAPPAAFVILWTGVLTVAAFTWAPRPWAAVDLTPLLVLVAVVDLEHHLILDETILTGVITGLALATAGLSMTLWSAIGGLLLIGGLMLVVGILGRGGMGGGDVKFGAVIGVFAGPWLGLLALFFGFILAALAGVGLLLSRRKGRKDAIPFGPFLAAGTFLAVVWGMVILQAYTHLVLK